MEESVEYFNKLPETRKKELRKMFKLLKLMAFKGATSAERDRIIRYSRLVGRLAYARYTPARLEFGIDLLLDKYYDKNYPVSSADVANWIYELTHGKR